MIVGYFADGPWSHQALEMLLSDEGVEVMFVCARNDCPDPLLKDIATGRGISFITHPNVNSDDFLARMSARKCDLFVSMSFDQIFNRRLIELPVHQSINCHAGKLPFYRGRNILNWALINDEGEFGITVHYIDEGIDTGDIIIQCTYPIGDDDDYSTLLRRAYSGCAELLYKSVKSIQNGSVTRTPQSSIHPIGFYCCARKEGDEVLDWQQSSREVFSFVRAICRPGPEARTYLRGTEVRINKVEWIPNAPRYKGIPGAVLTVGREDFLVKTGDSFVRVVEWSGDVRVRRGDRFA